MYVCLECGCTFENPSSWREPHGESLNGCPACGGAYGEAEYCSRCGKYIPENYYHLCTECKQEAVNRYEQFLSTFSQREREFLADRYEGVYMVEALRKEV